MEKLISFYKGKRVLITGHTGFKGSWLSQILVLMGAKVIGYSLEPKIKDSLFELLHLESKMISIIGDIKDYEKLFAVCKEHRPQLIFHLAAQPLVKDGYSNPKNTYDTNVTGTVNILESIRNLGDDISFLNVTTDKVYLNNEWHWGYRESDRLEGYDPYSNSKSCSELVTHTYNRSFFCDNLVKVSTARAGNVIGGGDFSENRIIPDCVRAVVSKTEILVRNKMSIRPYQHVLEPLMAYLLINMKQSLYNELQGSYNVGPLDKDCVSTGKLVSIFCSSWGDNASWISKPIDEPHEANFLKLDISKIYNTLGWKPLWNISIAIDKTIEWSKVWKESGNIVEVTVNQIKQYLLIFEASRV